MSKGFQQLVNRIIGMISHSVSKKLFLTVFLAMVGMIVGFGSITYQIAERNVVNKVRGNSEQAVAQIVKRLDLKMEAYKQASLLFTDDQEVQADVVSISRKDKLSFESLQASNRLEKRLSLVVSANDGLLSAKLIPYDTNRKEDWYRSITAGDGAPVWLEARDHGYAFQTPRSTFGVGRVIKNTSKNKPLRVLVLEADIKVIRSELEALSNADDNSIMLIGATGNLIQWSGSGKYKVGRSIGWWKSSPLAKEKLMGSGSFRKAVNGEEYLLIYSTSTQTGWTCVNQIPIGNLVREAGDIWRVTALMVLLAIALAVIVGWVMVRRIGRPLVMLSDLMKKSEKGDLSVRADIRHKDEIGQVAESFNVMIEKLRDQMEIHARNAQLELQVELEAKQREYAETLSSAVASLSSTMDMDELLRLTITHFRRIVPSSYVEILLFEADQTEPETALCFSEDSGFAKLKVDREKGIRLREIETQLDGDRRWCQIPGNAEESRELCVIPIRFNTLYAVFCFEYDDFDKSEPVLENGFMFFSQAAAVMENARAYREMRVLATTDGLTGVYNRRHFFKLAESIMEQSISLQEEASLVLFDIDHFKKFNDQYGHLAGDEVLKFVSKLIVGNLRGGDFIGRYGGEEFIILLRDTAEEEAVSLADRLRCSIENSELLYQGASLKVTASFGVARCCEGKSLLDVINRADTALYAAKQKGRNCVVSAIDL